MKTIWKILVSVLAVLATTTAAADESRGTEKDAVALVKRAIRYYDQVGPRQALADFSKDPGPFVDRDLYVTVYDMTGKALAHINNRIVGKMMIDMRDPDGKHIVRERVEASSHATSGWQEYKYFNPMTRRVEPKKMYWEKHDNLLFGAGAYRPDEK